jgi:hypothetical protein
MGHGEQWNRSKAESKQHQESRYYESTLVRTQSRDQEPDQLVSES